MRTKRHTRQSAIREDAVVSITTTGARLLWALLVVVTAAESRSMAALIELSCAMTLGGCMYWVSVPAWRRCRTRYGGKRAALLARAGRMASCLLLAITITVSLQGWMSLHAFAGLVAFISLLYGASAAGIRPADPESPDPAIAGIRGGTPAVDNHLQQSRQYCYLPAVTDGRHGSESASGDVFHTPG